MESVLIYLIKSSIVSGIFYLFYNLVLRNESFFRLNRFYLLTSLVFAYTFPVVDINITSTSNEVIPIITTLQTTVNHFVLIEELPVITQKMEHSSFLQQHGLWMMAILTSIIFLFRFLKHLFQLRKTIIANEKITQSKFTLVLFKKHITFSFFRYIFISHDVWRSPNGKSILDHELSHIKHKHSYDRLFLETMLIAFWMNPFIYLYRKALEEVHEYQADNDVTTSNTSPSDYFKLVLQQSATQSYSPLMSPFSYKLIKKRIKMSTHKSNPIKKISLIAPIAIALIIIVLSSGATQLKADETIQKQENVISWPKTSTESQLFIDSPSEVILDNGVIKAGNVFSILINKNSQILMDGKTATIDKVKPAVKAFITSKSNYPITTTKNLDLIGETKVNMGVISLQKDVTTPDKDANAILNKVIMAYNEVRDEAAQKHFNKSYKLCSPTEQKAIINLHPRHIAIAPSKSINTSNGNQTNNNQDKQFIPPIKKEEITRVASGYGMRIHPILKTKKLHNGVDYVAPLNTKIIAIADGTVRMVKKDFTEGKGYGKYIIIDHSNGYSSLYSQLNDYNVKEGQQIKKGDTIGFLGSSGLSTGPHLHFEIKKNGQYINPVDIIK